jgi:hypothetical protein
MVVQDSRRIFALQIINFLFFKWMIALDVLNELVLSIVWWFAEETTIGSKIMINIKCLLPNILMSSFMIFHVANAWESFIAKSALERLVARMSSGMNYEVSFLWECSLATFMMTLIELDPWMVGLQMKLHSILSWEGFVAIGERAWNFSLSLVRSNMIS